MDLREVRETIFNSVKEELIGPGSEQTGINIEEEIITDLPSKRYVTGILFNKNVDSLIEDDVKNSEDNDEDIADDLQEDEYIKFKETIITKSKEDAVIRNEFEAIDDEYYEDMNNAHIIKKSTMGLTFFVDRDINEILVNLKGARYREVRISECMVAYRGDVLPLENKDISNYIYNEGEMLKLKQRFKNRDIQRWDSIGLFNNREEFKNKVYKLYNQCSRKSYKRCEINFDNPFKIKFENFRQGKILIENEKLKLFALKRKYNDKYSITVILINEETEEKQEKYVFQPEIYISSKENKFKFLTSNNLEKSINPEIDLLYRNKKTFGIGHGVSVDYLGINSKTGEGIIRTSYLPRYEVPNTNFEVPKVGDFDILSMFNLSDLSDINKKSIIGGLSEFIDRYEEWITDIKKQGENIEKSLQDAIKHNIEKCNIAKERMREGLNLLIDNKDAFKSFQLANKAMYIQRIQSNHKGEVESTGGFDVYKNFDVNSCRWRGFQLAFLLMVISSISDKNNKFRDIVDLIWIPTGGGKTEAYLGVSAFTIFYRRITRKEKGLGTTIIMRYTLRLLAAQQFERACKLICAFEYIRQEDEKVDLGDEPITIGLWIGSEQTPNSLLKAKEYWDEMKRNKYAENKFQLLKCPWCDEVLTRENKKYEESEGIGYHIPGGRKSKFIFRCTNKRCYYSEELPIQVVDECLYKEPPTLLFSTVDKFAMLPWKGEAINFFKYKQCDPPELIIQDELHLISGPLGTLVGLFETALDYLCTNNGIGPKIISSTATICEATEQVENLYNRKTLQFPPPGIEIEDSFFTKEENLENKAGRLYVGVMGNGQTQITTEIRLFASLLQRISKLKVSDDILDKYWTLVSYFNSIRELGKALTLVDDDVKDYMIRIASRTGVLGDTRKIYSASELTSRVPSSQIVKILDQLENNYPKDAINVLLATNMISVGVDVSRLNLMTIIGQPKLTSEYIQASSRVGRKDPGLVFTLYDGRKSRDESHYEIFQSYHQAFYKYVEPTSITPFSEPALDRMLHSVFITMIRHNNVCLNSEDSAIYFDDSSEDVVKIKKYILDRACNKNPEDRKIIENKLENIIKKWKDKSEIETIPLRYSKGANPLMNRFYEKSSEIEGFETMTSMRNVDGELNIKVLKREDE
ncbi:DEAD/DEAH box helicase [Clostridium perfringens]|uniref:helicase-related protein n=1 Tax=Clostridium perfringens TaxID=1502 RepID=UPI0013E3B65F|nr:helicase-related protein [Clostridium perfringens]EHK2388117.1 DEAD/DEAH box helicase [Clostridium perfringens]ELC8436530.1 DEAD/DEAH box helicase [Clostridium perfringens]MCX0385256.1 DEAD/DEAH box helicase [Clostridium perfringens]MDT7932185.1 helicase-related protein [Clostridium perfringens]MDT7956070.1 helicase-related protein [Clostridium perfringens]